MVSINTPFRHIALAAAAALFLFSCDSSSKGSHGPIVLGDSTTIVTESDPLKLKDLVTDLQPVIPPSENKDEDSKQEPPKDTAKATQNTSTATSQTTQQPLPDVAGLKAEFKDLTILIPDLTVKQSGKADLQHANGAVYTLQDGEINGSTLRISGNVTKVSQRYQSVVILKDDNVGTLVLEQLGSTTGWQQLKGNGSYKISGVDARSLSVPDADAGDIRNALTKAAKRRRMSRKATQELTSQLKHVRSANQKPLSLVLRSVMWKIDGIDAGGRAFSKQIRVDIPL